MTKTINDLLNAAIKEEVQAQKFYQEASEKTAVPKLKEFFKKLASEEKGHERILKGVKEMELYDGDMAVDEKLVAEIDGAHHVEGQKSILEMNMEEAMLIAMKKENKANRVYTHLSELSVHDELQKLFSSLAADEHRHATSIEKNYKIHTGQMGWEA